MERVRRRSPGGVLPPVSDWYSNPRSVHAASMQPADPRSVHRMLPMYEPTPLRDDPALARALGVSKLWIKDERWRLGLPSFKVLGASYALYHALRDRLGCTADWTSLADWQAAAAMLGPLTLAAATDGNHGQAVAYLARLLGGSAVIAVPARVSTARIEAIRAEGATVEIVNGTYDDAVAEVARLDGNHLVISDVAWDGYEQIPRWVIAGYEAIFAEIDEQLAAVDARQPSAVLVQAGVGALACAAVRHWRSRSWDTPVIIAVEPHDAACVLTGLRARRPQLVSGPHRSMMAGLNCGLVSPVALPVLVAGLDGAITVTDAHVRAAMRLLGSAGICGGETAAGGVAGLLALRSSPPTVRSALGLDGASEVLVICTEGISNRGYAANPQSTSGAEGAGSNEQRPVKLANWRRPF
jgi:diaminopropionate ammonia-lyase